MLRQIAKYVVLFFYFSIIVHIGNKLKILKEKK